MAGTAIPGLSDELQAELEKAARAQSRPVEEVLSEAVDRYLKEKQWQSLKSYGRQKARERGIVEGDVMDLIAQSRQEHSR
jgi:predicted transcriptional regulator